MAKHGRILMKKYIVTFREIYEYTKQITTEDSEDINEIIRDPLQCPMVKDMSDDEFEELSAHVENQYTVEEVTE